jgi:hypothetical protein
MKEYLLLFRNASQQEGYLATSEDMASDLPNWQAWISSIALQGKLVHTAPIEYQGKLVTAGVLEEGPHKQADSVLVSGFLICKSDRMEEVEAWSAVCPILKYPGSSVEIRPLIPFPNQ